MGVKGSNEINNDHCLVIFAGIKLFWAVLASGLNGDMLQLITCKLTRALQLAMNLTCTKCKQALSLIEAVNGMVKASN